MDDAKFRDQLEQLRVLSFTRRKHGANLSQDSYTIATHPVLRAWLHESDELASDKSGSVRLRKRRRRGILRHLDGPHCGLPFFEPPLDIYKTRSAPEPRVLPLWDELEWVVISGRLENGRWSPVKDELTFDDGRAIARMMAATLYGHTANRKVPGQKWMMLGGDRDRNLQEIRFDTVAFMGWAEISDID